MQSEHEIIRKEEELAKLRKIALTSAKHILSEMGINPNHREYGSMQYKLQFEIYHTMKSVFNIQSY